MCSGQFMYNKSSAKCVSNLIVDVLVFLLTYWMSPLKEHLEHVTDSFQCGQ